MKTQLSVVGLLLLSSSSFAGISIGGTRLIFNAGDKEANISVNNSDKDHVYLIQSWVEKSDSQTEKAPFLVTPPLFRLDADQRNILRILKTSNTLPTDRESMFWLNIKAIPAMQKNMQDKNILQFSVKNRIKLFHRPQGLAGTPEIAASKLEWHKQGNSLTAQNKSGYFVSLSTVSVNGQNLKIDYSNNTIAPFSTSTFSSAGAAQGEISWKVLNDYGAVSQIYHSSMQ